MPKKRAPERDQAKDLYLKEKGKISPKNIAEKLGVSPAMVRKWKYADQWEAELHKKRRGGQPGNQNAVGNSGGAPKGNLNAETHGAYTIPRMERWTPEQREELEHLTLEFDPLAERQLRGLLAKQQDLERRISELDGPNEDETLFLDRMMTMEIPGGGNMKYKSESTKFSRRMVLEGELNKVQGRIQKLLDSIRAREEAKKRMEFERERFQFGKQKALGEFSVNDSGEIIQEVEADEIIE